VRIALVVALFLLPGALGLPGSLGAQEVTPGEIPEESFIPEDLVEVELERSRMCVPVMGRLADLDARLAPLAERAERLGRLEAAIAVEDSARVSPFDEADALDQAVRDWFVADAEMGRRVADGEEAVQEERAAARQAIRERLRDEFDSVNERAQELLGGEEDLREMAPDCQGAILVRSAVLEACENLDTRVCQEAREPTADGRFRFVDSPSDLWDVEQIRPWSDPSGLRPSQGGGLTGARTTAMVRRGNVTFVLGLEPVIRDRAQVGEEQAAEFDAHLDALGFSFDAPGFVMAPALAIEIDIIAPLGGESHYLVHFGDLADPAQDVIWMTPAGSGGPIQGIAPTDESILLRLASGEEVSLTAVRIPEEIGEDEAVEGEAVFSLGISAVGQAQAVSALVGYMGGGQLAADLGLLFPSQDPSDR